MAQAFANALGADFAASVTPEFFKEAVRKLLQYDALVTPDTVGEILGAAATVPLREFYVVRPVHGVIFKTPVNRLGRTTVRSPDELRKQMKTWPGERTLLGAFPMDGPTAEVVVRARTTEAALRLGDRVLSEFESIVRIVACGSGGQTDFNVFEVRAAAHLPYLVHGQNGTISGTDLTGPGYEMEYTEDELLQDQFTTPVRALWDIHSREERTAVERKIMTAAYWFSLARRELDAVRSVPFAWYSIEALLPYSSAESTLSQIARWASHLIDVSSANAELRKKDIERLYNHRSDIAHGRVSFLPDEVRKEALGLCEFLLNNACDERIRHASDEKAFSEAILAISHIRDDSPAPRRPSRPTTDAYCVRKDAPRLRERIDHGDQDGA